MKTVGYILAFILTVTIACILLVGCNSVKRVLADPKKTEEVGREWERRGNGCVSSTTIEYRQGKTDTLIEVDIIEVFDTTYVTDSFETVTPVLKYKDRIITRTITRTDTIEMNVEDTRRLQLVQADLNKAKGSIETLEKSVKNERKRGNMWMWVAIAAFGLIGIGIFLRFKKIV